LVWIIGGVVRLAADGGYLEAISVVITVLISLFPQKRPVPKTALKELFLPPKNSRFFLFQLKRKNGSPVCMRMCT
jgi:hypothetical protein